MKVEQIQQIVEIAKRTSDIRKIIKLMYNDIMFDLDKIDKEIVELLESVK